jgi:hypothetical protein
MASTKRLAGSAQAKARWRELLLLGPEWRGGHGMLQERENRAFMRQLAEAARILEPHLARTEQVLLSLVDDLAYIVDLPADDSFGTLVDGVGDVAQAFTPVFAGYSGRLCRLADAMAAAASMPGSEYVTFNPSGDWANTPLGMWVTAVGPRLATEIAERLVPDQWTDRSFVAGLAAFAASHVPA